MSKGYLRAIALIAFAIMGFAATGYGYKYLRAIQMDPYPAATYQPADHPVTNGSGTANNNPIPYEPGCYAPGNQLNSDLCAQWTAVKAAEHANRISAANLWLATATFVLSILGTGALIWTLAETRAVSRRELRAYLFVDGSAVGDGTYLPDRAQHLLGIVGSAVIIKNSGQTPAHHVIHWSAVRIAPFSDEDNLKAPIKLDEAVTATTLPPGGSNSADRIMEVKASDAEIDAIKKGASAIWVYGRIEYTDVFQKRHRTSYRLYFCGSWPPPQGIIMRNAKRGNDAT